MEDLIKTYLSESEHLWSPTTLRSTKSRLLSMRSPLTKGEPAELWSSLAGRLKPYSRCTYWSVATSFLDWLIEEGHRDGPNKLRSFKRKNKQLFRNAYTRNLPQIDLREALRRIGTLTHRPSREKALQLIQGGLRWAESFAIDSNGYCTGKGGKVRRIYKERARICIQVKYWRFLKDSKKIGLKPHDYRKIFASELVRKDINPFELQQIMGWASCATAESYVKCDENKLEKRVKEMIG